MNFQKIIEQGRREGSTQYGTFSFPQDGVKQGRMHTSIKSYFNLNFFGTKSDVKPQVRQQAGRVSTDSYQSTQ